MGHGPRRSQNVRLDSPTDLELVRLQFVRQKGAASTGAKGAAIFGRTWATPDQPRGRDLLFDSAGWSPYGQDMEVQLQPDKEAQLAEIAARSGIDPRELVHRVLSGYLEDKAPSECCGSPGQPKFRTLLSTTSMFSCG
jgi:hypothetical protein